MTTVLASAALVLAVVALALTIIVMRQSADTTSELRAHRRAHSDAHGHPDPKLDRRQVQLGPPRTVGERRGARHHEPPLERYMPPLPDRLVVTAAELTADEAQNIRERIAAPGPPTEQLPAAGLPTEAMPAVERPTPPR